jgi:hypothetical protein
VPNNTNIVAKIDDAGFVNANIAGEVIREIDLGEYSEKLTGVTLQVCVNPPAFLVKTLWATDDELTRAKIIAALAVMTGIPVNAFERWSDTLVATVFYRARGLFWDYDGELRKNLTAR